MSSETVMLCYVDCAHNCMYFGSGAAFLGKSYLLLSVVQSKYSSTANK